jgi:hypothetical protein
VGDPHRDVQSRVGIRGAVPRRRDKGHGQRTLQKRSKPACAQTADLARVVVAIVTAS